MTANSINNNNRYQPIEIKTINVQSIQTTIEDTNVLHHHQHSNNNKTIWLCYFLLGTINNLIYVVILSSAESIAKSFNSLQYIGVIAWSNVFAGIIVRIINTLYWLDTSHNKRILLCSIVNGISLLCLSISIHINFISCVVCITMLGCCSSLGESVILGHMKHTDPVYVGSWSSGTGMAGLVGTLIYLLLHSIIQLNNDIVYLILFPTSIIYYIAWYYVYKQHSVTINNNMNTNSITLNTNEYDDYDNNNNISKYTQLSTPNSRSRITSTTDSNDSSTSTEQCSNYDILIYSLNGAIQLALVYFFEYVVSIEFASRSNRIDNTNSKTHTWLLLNAYEVLQFCYQLGVLIARSSISIIQIQRIYILTILQCINFIIWYTQIVYFYMNIYIQLVCMIYVGLLGGAMYVNTFNNILRDTKLSDNQRELSVNYTQISINIGIVLSSVFDVVFEQLVKR